MTTFLIFEGSHQGFSAITLAPKKNYAKIMRKIDDFCLSIFLFFFGGGHIWIQYCQQDNDFLYMNYFFRGRGANEEIMSYNIIKK